MPIGRVLCLGGSLTAGNDSVGAGFRTYRGTLQNALATAGLTLDFVGPNVLAAAAGGNDPNHAGWADASIDATGSAGNNLTSRLAALKTDFPTVDLVIIDPPWWDIQNAPASLATRYSTFIGAVQSGAWASTRILMCTAHPASGQTAAQTSGAYAAWGAVNSAIAALRTAAPTTRFVADLAALTSGATSSTLTELALGYAQRAPEFSTTEGGASIPNWQGGHLVTSFRSIQDFNAMWSRTPPNGGNAPGGTGLFDWSVESWNGTVNRFVQSVAGVTPWYWIWCLPGHGASNSCVEIRNGFAAAKRRGGGWEFFFAGSRFGVPGDQVQLWDGRTPVGYLADGRAQAGQRPDGLTTWHAPRGNVGIEAWPVDTVPSRGIIGFHGGFNRDLLANAEAFWWGGQCRLALINPFGADDRAQARFGACCGADYFSTLGGRHYDRIGWPYNAMDGGHDAWSRIDWTEWRMISAITIGREGFPDTGVHPEYHWSDPGTPPPLANWSPPTPYNDPSAGRAMTASQVRANPLPVPPYWEGSVATGGTGSGYQVADYHLPSGGSRLFLLTQSGADKIAGVMSSAIIGGGVLAGFTGGGVIFELVAGLATRPDVAPRLNAGGVNNVAPKNRASGGTGPQWQTDALPVAVVGTPYVAGLSAPADPAPTYSIISGAPAWLALNASTGALTGTPTGGEATHTIVARATNAAGSSDRTFTLTVTAGVLVTTTSLPPATVSRPYLVRLDAAGFSPFAWSIVTSGPFVLAQLATQVASQSGTDGILLWDASATQGGANLLTDARAFDAAAWIKQAGAVVVPNAGTAPDGSTTADLLYPTVSGSLRALYQSAGGATDVRVFAKAAGATTLSVVSPDGTAYIATFDLQSGVVASAGVGVVATIEPQGNGWHLCSVSSRGALPAGLALQGDAISGTPTTIGSSSFTVRAVDALGNAATRALTLQVVAASALPVITTTSLPAGAVGVAYSATIAATGDAPITRAVVSGALPPGLALNASTGAITGTPTSAGGFGLTVRATNAVGDTEATFYLSIAATAAEPVSSPWARFTRQ